jgi:hypothetical protein
MKTIEAWAVVRESGNILVFTESEARRYAQECFGTAVKLTGQMPEKVEKTVWINLYMNESSTLYPGNTMYNSEEEAIKVGRGTWGYFGTFQKTVEVDE